MVTDGDGGDTYVLRLEAVRWAIDVLSSQRIHPFFLAYLHLRVRAHETGNDHEIRPRWNDLAVYLEVPGGPPNKPYYRPLWDQSVRDRSRYWLNRNLAGSYAPSSLRRGSEPYKVVDTTDGRFSLKPDHAALARKHLLFDQPVPVQALATFLYRDFSFTPEDEDLDEYSVVDVFCQDFRFIPTEADEDFSKLFLIPDPDAPLDWFELLTADTVGAIS